MVYTVEILPYSIRARGFAVMVRISWIDCQFAGSQILIVSERCHFAGTGVQSVCEPLGLGGHGLEICALVALHAHTY